MCKRTLPTSMTRILSKIIFDNVHLIFISYTRYDTARDHTLFGARQTWDITLSNSFQGSYINFYHAWIFIFVCMMRVALFHNSLLLTSKVGSSRSKRVSPTWHILKYKAVLCNTKTTISMLIIIGLCKCISLRLLKILICLTDKWKLSVYTLEISKLVCLQRQAQKSLLQHNTHIQLYLHTHS